jgi:hypothetical protein
VRRFLLAAGSLAVISAVQVSSASAVERTSALVLLTSLPVSAERQGGYDRSLFADFLDSDGNGCDTREDVLIAEAIGGTEAGCRVAGGRWLSRYDGVTTRNAGALDIDHRVPLKEAWSSGAWRWRASTRDRYANDMGYAQSLVAVTASSNRSKGDREPGEWMPPLASQRCPYLRLWIGVKYRWRLAVDSSEKSYLTRQLRSCPTQMTVPRRAVVRTR